LQSEEKHFYNIDNWRSYPNLLNCPFDIHHFPPHVEAKKNIFINNDGVSNIYNLLNGLILTIIRVSSKGSKFDIGILIVM
jgi:hypothetical protein